LFRNGKRLGCGAERHARQKAAEWIRLAETALPVVLAAELVDGGRMRPLAERP
jgi:hypothetical protein